MGFERIKQVIDHSQAKGQDRAVLIVLAYHDGGNGIYPGIQKLAAEAGLSKHGVQSSIKRLAGLGELTVIPHGGYQNRHLSQRTNLYEITLCATTQAPSTPQVPDTPQEPPQYPTGTSPSAPQEPTQYLPGTRTSSQPPFKSPFQPQSLSPRERVEFSDRKFDEFYSLYPRKRRPDKAKEAWQKAIEETTPEIIIEAVKQFADRLPPDQNIAYVPYPSTWLKNWRWEDEW